jgi:hypothetical protein
MKYVGQFRTHILKVSNMDEEFSKNTYILKKKRKTEMLEIKISINQLKNTKNKEKINKHEHNF